MDQAKYPQFILLGDSLIQYTSSISNQGYHFGGGLAEHCIRRLDVVNRGFSGYNSSQILKILEHLIPSQSCADVEFLLILLGANDSCLPTSPTGQHVPLEKYRENIKAIVTHPSITAHSPAIFLVTPPPINECHLELVDLKKGYSAVTRQQSFTSQYAETIREIATEFKDRKVILVDLWAALMKEALRRSPGNVEGGALLGSKEAGDSEGLRGLLVDGLHLTGLAYRIFLDALLPLLDTIFKEGHKDALPWVFPHWSIAPKIK